MEKQIEVEFIGEIKKEHFENLKSKFENEGKFIKKKERVSFMYFRDEIPNDLAEIKDEDTDIRLRITNNEGEIVVKKGSFTGTHSRKEISIPFPVEEIQNYVDFLASLDWTIGIVYAVKTLVYEYEDIEFSLVDIDGFGFNFEAEILTTPDEEPKAREKIERILTELNLVPFDEESLNKHCNLINNSVQLKFDFSKENIQDIKNRFPKFFN